MILLDTHALLWWSEVEPSRLSEEAERVLASSLAPGALKISTITSWEISMLVAKGRLGLNFDVLGWTESLAALSFVEFIPIDNRIAVEANQLPGDFHRDPADRLIVATARLLDMPLLTADTKILDYPFVQTIW